MRANSTRDVKMANRQFLYECIREHKSVTMTELEHITKLSRPTIVGLIREMEADKTVIKSGRGSSNGGRAPTLYSINAKVFYAIGIDFEFPTVRMAISDLEGTPVLTCVEHYPVDADKDETLSLLTEQLQQFIQSSGIDKKDFLGIGMGIPGIMDSQNKSSVVIDRIHGWVDVPIWEILTEHFGIPVYIQNDVNLLAWAEKRLWPKGEFDNMQYIAIRAGLGMAVMMNGKLLDGESGNLGLIGHMIVNAEGAQCHCGSHGCLGLYTSELALFQKYKKNTGKEISSVDDLIKLADQGDEAALHVLECAGRYLGVGIVNVANLFDISHIVVSARFKPDMLLKFAMPEINIRNNRPKRRKIYVSAARMDESQYALGGCLMVIDIVRPELHLGLQNP